MSASPTKATPRGAGEQTALHLYSPGPTRPTPHRGLPAVHHLEYLSPPGLLLSRILFVLCVRRSNADWVELVELGDREAGFGYLDYVVSGRQYMDIEQPGNALRYARGEYKFPCATSPSRLRSAGALAVSVGKQHARGRVDVKRSVSMPRRRKKRPVEISQTLGNSSSAGWSNSQSRPRQGRGREASDACMHVRSCIYCVRCELRVSESQPLRLRPEPSPGNTAARTDVAKAIPASWTV